MRNHTNPSWAVSIGTADQDDPDAWLYNTWQGEPADPSAVVRLAGDGFDYVWEFDDEVVPPLMRAPSQITFVLSCASGEDIPPINQGYLVTAQLIRPDGVVTRDIDGNLSVAGDVFTILDNTFRVKAIDAEWDLTIERLLVKVECTDLATDLGSNVDLAQQDWNETVYDYFGSVIDDGETSVQAAVMTFIAGETTVAFAERWHPAKIGELSLTNLNMNRSDVKTVSEVVSALCAPEFAEDGSKYIPYVVGDLSQLPFDPYDDVTEDNPTGTGPEPVHGDPSGHTGVAFLAEWSPTAEVTAPPYELILDGSGDVSIQPDPTPGLDPVILPASVVEASPDWRRDTSRSVNQVTWSGWNSNTDEDTTLRVSNRPAQAADGIVPRTIDTFGLISGSAVEFLPEPTTGKVCTVRDARIDEASYLAYSGNFLNTMWTGNDEGATSPTPQLFGFSSPPFSVDTTIAFSGGYTITDPEALCLYGGKLYLADIGDNDSNRAAGNIAIYAVTEPTTTGTKTITPTRYPVSYGGLGSINAESLLIHPVTGVFYIITKEAGNSRVLSFSGTLSTVSNNVFTLVDSDVPAFVSDACFTIDGLYALLRCKDVGDTIVVETGGWTMIDRIPTPTLVQGESITMHPDGNRFEVGSEGVNSPIYRVALPRQYRPVVPDYYGTPLGRNAHTPFLSSLYTNSADDGAPWAPDEITVLTNLMDDDQLDVFLPRFNPREQLQHAFLLHNIEADANPAAGVPIWSTLIGCQISIRRTGGEARIVVVPKLKSYRPPGLTSPNAVTWDDLAVSPYATKTGNDLDPNLTGDLIALTHA